MRNFPHQFARLQRFSYALRVYEQAVRSGVHVDDDQQLGLIFVREDVYQFRGHPADIEQRIAEELQKPAESRGMQTAAREMRRTFFLLGLIGADDRLTDLGLEIRQEEGEAGVTDRSKLLWQFAFWTMTLDQPNYHPYQVLLRLVREKGPLHKFQLTLCFEATDDSEAEFQRTIGLLHLNEEQLRETCGASKAAFENNQKILPSVAEDLGDLTKRGLDEYVFRSRDIEPIPARTQRTTLPARHERRRDIETRQIEGTGVATYEVNTDKRANRRNRHEALVNQLADHFAQFAPTEIHGGCDLIVTTGEHRVIFEVKTIEGDQYTQVLAAVGQLFFYKFSYGGAEKGIQVRLVIVVDRPVDPRLHNFASSLGIGLLAFFGTTIHYMTDAAREILEPFQ